MKRQHSKFMKVSASLLCTALLFACSNDTKNVPTHNESTAEAESLRQEVASVISEHVTYSDEDFYNEWEDATSIQLNGSSASFEGDREVVIDKNIITIKTSGVYTIQGKLDDGQIIVDTEDDGIVRLVLNGADIHSSTTSAIYVKQAEKTIISLEKGTENVLSDGAKYVYENSEEDEPNAALFSKDDLTINGSGKLVVQGNYNDGITSKDQLKITGGTIQIHSADDGIVGRDLLAVKEGSVRIEASGDGMKSMNDKDASKGIIAIEGGSFDIKSVNDGIQAETYLLIADGDFNISSGGGSPENIANVEMGRSAPGEMDTSIADTSSETASAKGLKANEEVAIGGGSITLDSLDDAIHSNHSVTITGGELNVATGDDGIHADTSILIKGGNIDITKSYEGIESGSIAILDGEIHVKANDDGINISGGSDNVDTSTEQTDDRLLSINGGYIYVDAAGDGLDSNGSISMTGGTVIVNGPTNNGNGALDYDEDFEISGGVLIAAGSSGMAMATSENSSQNTILMSYPKTQSAGIILHLEDSEGKEIVTFAPEKDYQSVVISSPKLTKDASYTLYSGDTTSGKESDGLFEDSDYQGGTKVVEFTISDTVTWLDESGITTAKKSGPGGMGAPKGMEKPDGMKAPNDGQLPPKGKGNREEIFSNLDEKTRTKVQSIMDEQREGTITWEEAQKQLEELGVEIPR
ncbi:carbohydrate-binding domain-containing protein [Sporosarcina obsidiansis]|uniref:carbohydrate-binding domain-containing protein n=1 Tax=Sporosarcina obsidiansis TaxID=2660748 RepID=UPI00129A1277|nr:carbohydrate-binding domain-containing protein [Sporosarcina obsidiansis]